MVSGVAGDQTTWYFGAVAGGVWKSSDAGASWKPVFDAEKIAMLEGTVKEFQWTNPHAWIIVSVGKESQVQDWAVLDRPMHVAVLGPWSVP